MGIIRQRSNAKRKRKQISFSIDPANLVLLRHQSEKTGDSLSAIVNGIIELYFVFRNARMTKYLEEQAIKMGIGDAKTKEDVTGAIAMKTVAAILRKVMTGVLS